MPEQNRVFWWLNPKLRNCRKMWCWALLNSDISPSNRLLKWLFHWHKNVQRMHGNYRLCRPNMKQLRQPWQNKSPMIWKQLIRLKQNWNVWMQSRRSRKKRWRCMPKMKFACRWLNLCSMIWKHKFCVLMCWKTAFVLTDVIQKRFVRLNVKSVFCRVRMVLLCLRVVKRKRWSSQLWEPVKTNKSLMI